MTARNHSLDLLRGLAIAMVVLTHCAQAAGSVIPGLKSFAENYGERGVQLFFIISGYTMMLTFGSVVTSATIRSFYIRRIFRIAPLFWIAIVFYQLLPATASTRFWAPGGVSVADITLTFLFLQWSSVTAFNSVVPGGWSIAVEVQFYLLFPLLIYAFRKPGGSLLCYAAIALLYVAAEFTAQRFLIPHMAASLPAGQEYLANAFYYCWLPRQLICFGFGILLYDYLELKNRPTVGTLLLIGASLFTGWGSQITILAAIAFGCLAFKARSSIVEFFGQHSYAIYLVHFAVIAAVITRMSVDLFWLFLLVMCLSLAISYFITGPLIERRCNRLGHELANRIHETKRPALQSM